MKSQGIGPESGKGRGIFVVTGNLIMAAQQNNLPVLFSYCNSFFIRDVYGEFGLVNVHFFRHCIQFCLEKSMIFFCLETGNPAHVRLSLSSII